MYVPQITWNMSTDANYESLRLPLHFPIMNRIHGPLRLK